MPACSECSGIDVDQTDLTKSTDDPSHGCSFAMASSTTPVDDVKPQPHPHALFSLIPYENNRGAQMIIEQNRHLVSVIPNFHDVHDRRQVMYGINVGFFIGNRSRGTLASIGRNGDIVTPTPPSAWPGASKWARVSRIQCSFEVHPNANVVLLYDRSSRGDTDLTGVNARSFVLGRVPRRVVIGYGINDRFAFRDVEFQIVWHSPKIHVGEQMTLREDHPRLTHTVDEVPTIAATRRATRIHTPAPAGSRVELRYTLVKKLGQGMSGQVWKVVDIDSGDILAVKRIRRPDEGGPEYERLKREVETMPKLSHPNIVEFISTQRSEWPGQDVPPGANENASYLEIFMLPKEGNIRQLKQAGRLGDGTDQVHTDRLLHDGLKGLDYLASLNVKHRDVKPENILWTVTDQGATVFQFADFGLCNTQSLAVTFAGSRVYMAPEVLTGNGEV